MHRYGRELGRHKLMNWPQQTHIWLNCLELGMITSKNILELVC